MGPAERRLKILKTLCRRRYETIDNLASEFGVSERTIRRDIECLSLDNPIYTQKGKYGGGIYVLDNYKMERMYMDECEISVLKKLNFAMKQRNILTEEEKTILSQIILSYTKPLTKKGKTNESKRKTII